MSTQQRRDAGRVTYQLTFPDGVKFEQITEWLNAVRANLGTERYGIVSVAMVLETLFMRDGIRHRLRVPGGPRGQQIYNQLEGHVPGIDVEVVDDPAHPAWTHAEEYGTTNHNARLGIDRPVAMARTILNSAGDLLDGEEAVVQLVITAAARQRVSPEPSRTYVRTRSTVLDMALGMVPRGDGKEQRAKLEQPNFLAIMRVAAKARSKGRAAEIVTSIGRAVASAESNHAGFRRLLRPGDAVERVKVGAVPMKYPAQITLTELGALAAYRLESLVLPGLVVPGTRHMRPIAGFPDKGIVLAKATKRSKPGEDRLLAFNPVDTTTHVQVIGMTGVGKSNVFKLAARSLIDQGLGFILIQPKREMNEEVLRLVGPGRLNDLIYLDPTDAVAPVGLNPLRGRDPNKVTSFMMDVFTSLWDAGVQTGDVLRTAIYTVARKPGMTLHEVALILNNIEFCERMTADLPQGVVKDFWDGFKAMKDTERKRLYEPVMRRLRPFLWPQFSAVFGQSKGLDLKRAIASGKIIVVNLSVGEMGDDSAYLFGGMVVAMVWDAIQERSQHEGDAMRPFTFMADEFHKYMKLPTDFDTVAATARGYRFPLWLAHQDMAQLGRLRDAVVTNCRNRIVFRTNSSDALALSNELHIHREDIMKLGKYHAIFSTTRDGDPLPPATGYTLEPPKPVGEVAAAIEASRRNYGTPLESVEEEMRNRRDIPSARPARRAPLGG